MTAITLSILTSFLVLRGANLSFAEELSVCGDTVIEEVEQCDDGNLVNGDGCSNHCTIEQCGNGMIDGMEQCDDGDLINGDGCTRECQIEFCGDDIHQVPAEQCDDGNNDDGDGCSERCEREGKEKTILLPTDDQEEKGESVRDTTVHKAAPAVSSAPSAIQTTVKTTKIVSKTAQIVATATKFLESPEAEGLVSRLSDEIRGELMTLLKKIAAELHLTKEERLRAQSIATELEEAKVEERMLHLNLLRAFLSSKISNETVQKNAFDSEILTGSSIPTLLSELESVGGMPTATERVSIVERATNLLRNNGVDGMTLSEEERAQLESKNPLDVLHVLQQIKDRAEGIATKNVEETIQDVRDEITRLEDELPARYGEAQAALKNAQEIIDQTTDKDAERAVIALERVRRTIAREGMTPLHGAAPVSERLGENLEGETTDVPPLIRETFVDGTTQEQISVLREMLQNDTRLQELRVRRQQQSEQDMEVRYEKLMNDITLIGRTRETMTPCDNTVAEALECIHAYATDLEAAVRRDSVFLNIVGSLQDFFGIGHE